MDILNTPLALSRATGDLAVANVVSNAKKQIEANQKEQPPIRARVRKIFTNTGEQMDYEDFKGSDIQKSLIVDGQGWGNVAVVDIKGFIQRNNYIDWWSWSYKYGTDAITQTLRELGQDERIKAVMLHVDSGGGMVSGTETLAKAVANFKTNYKKPIWAFVDTVAASAAYWIVSGANKIILSENSASVGSIGVLTAIADFSEFYKEMGIVEVVVKSSLAFNKNKPYEDAVNGKTEALRQELDKVAAVFLGDIKRNRGAKAGLMDFDFDTATVENTPEVLTGKMYYGQDAVTVGLADKVGSVEGLEAEIKALQKERKVSDVSTESASSQQDPEKDFNDYWN